MIRNIQLNHGGKYICLIDTDVESLSADAILVVKGRTKLSFGLYVHMHNICLLCQFLYVFTTVFHSEVHLARCVFQWKGTANVARVQRVLNVSLGMVYGASSLLLFLWVTLVFMAITHHGSVPGVWRGAVYHSGCL